ncbi:MAG: type II toxin-antitoxin system VapC family toxin [Pyrinomonadaceae bacterium]
MKTKAAFWDSSALVPLCVRQSTSQEFHKQWRLCNRVVVWWGAPVEIRSTLSRLHRDNVINAKGLQYTLTRLDAMRGQWREVLPSDKLRALAETIPDAYGLRALDSFQLAAMLVWCNEKPTGRFFMCDDTRLSDAARKAGFTVNP